MDSATKQSIRLHDEAVQNRFAWLRSLTAGDVVRFGHIPTDPQNAYVTILRVTPARYFALSNGLTVDSLGHIKRNGYRRYIFPLEQKL